MIVFSDEWEGSRARSIKADIQDGDELVRLIDRLDGQRYTIVRLQGDPEHDLTVGGGGKEFIVYASLGADEFAILLNPAGGERLIILNVGGQEGEYRTDEVVDKGSALACASTFLRTQQLDQGFQWRRT